MVVISQTKKAVRKPLNASNDLSMYPILAELTFRLTLHDSRKGGRYTSHKR